LSPLGPTTPTGPIFPGGPCAPTPAERERESIFPGGPCAPTPAERERERESVCVSFSFRTRLVSYLSSNRLFDEW